MAAVSLFWDTNMAAVTSCENILYLHFTAPFQIAALTKGASMIGQQLVFKRIARNSATYLGTLQVTVLTDSTQFDMRGLQVRPFNYNIH